MGTGELPSLAGEPPATPGKNIPGIIDFSLATQAEINRMRIRLMEELRKPFVRRVETAPLHHFIRQVKAENFDERLMTLQDKEIFDLYTDYRNIRSINDDEKREHARDSILDRLAFSILSDGQFLKRIT